MCARYNPILTDGQITDTLTGFKTEAKRAGLILEPVELRAAQNYRVLQTTANGPKEIKRLRKIGAESITRVIKNV